MGTHAGLEKLLDDGVLFGVSINDPLIGVEVKTGLWIVESDEQVEI